MFDTPIQKGLFTFYKELQDLERMSPQAYFKGKKKKDNNFSNKKKLKSQHCIRSPKETSLPFNFNIKKKKGLVGKYVQKIQKISQKQLLHYQTKYLNLFQNQNSYEKHSENEKQIKIELNNYVKSRMIIHNMNKNKTIIQKQKPQIKPYCLNKTKLNSNHQSLPLISKNNIKISTVIQKKYAQKQRKKQLTMTKEHSPQKIKNPYTCNTQNQIQIPLNCQDYLKDIKKRWSSFSYNEKIIDTQKEQEKSNNLSSNFMENLTKDERQNNSNLLKECIVNENKAVNFHLFNKCQSKFKVIQNQELRLFQNQPLKINVQEFVNQHRQNLTDNKSKRKNSQPTQQNQFDNNCSKHIKMTLLKHIRKYPVKKFQQLNRNSKNIFLICETLDLNLKKPETIAQKIQTQVKKKHSLYQIKNKTKNSFLLKDSN